MRQIQIGNVTETVVERADYPPEKIKAILGKETVAVLGYGVQGRGQSLNMKDNGVNVVIGLREKGGKSWDLATQDGWVGGKSDCQKLLPQLGQVVRHRRPRHLPPKRDRANQINEKSLAGAALGGVEREHRRAAVDRMPGNGGQQPREPCRFVGISSEREVYQQRG